MSESRRLNQAQHWFRALLWVVPTTIAVASFIGFDWLGHRVGWLDGRVGRWTPFLVAAFLIFCVGLFEGFLIESSDVEGRQRRTADLVLRAIMFLLIQSFFFIPGQLLLCWFAWNAIQLYLS
jgi:hypothetical protein